MAESESRLGFWLLPSASLAAVPTATPQSPRVLTEPVLGWGPSSERGRSLALGMAASGGQCYLAAFRAGSSPNRTRFPHICVGAKPNGMMRAERRPGSWSFRSPRPRPGLSLPSPSGPCTTRPRRHKFSLARAPFLHLSLSQTVVKLFEPRMKESRGVSLPSGCSEPGREDEPANR